MHHELGIRGGFDGVLLSRSTCSLLSPVCTIVWNKSKLAETKALQVRAVCEDLLFPSCAFIRDTHYRLKKKINNNQGQLVVLRKGRKTSKLET